jgi:1,4-alpha-glucan branching enzyme
MKTGTTVPYATRRINEHILQFNKLYEDVKAAKVNERWLSDVEERNNIFPQIDYRIFAS